MNDPFSFSVLARSVWHDFIRLRRPLFIFDFLYKLVAAWLLVPATALLLAFVLASAGHIAVNNRDILDFLLTPFGFIYAAILATVSVALLLFEQSGIMLVAAPPGPVKRPSAGRILLLLGSQMLRVVQLSAIKLALLSLAILPFGLLAVLTYQLLLTGHDIYYYVTDRPPAFWVAAGIGAVLLLAALAVGGFLYVRWALALPLLIFERQFGLTALRASRDRVRGAGWRIGALLLGWHFGALLLGVGLETALRFLAALILDRTGERPVLLILVLLLVQGGLLATWTFITVVGQGLLIRRLYLLRSERLGPSLPGESAAGSDATVPPWDWRVAGISLALCLLPPVVLWVHLSQYLEARPPAKVTAHRGHARAAPENTLSAIRKAIESGADYAEVDVQMTADGVLVLLHDTDLKRVAGDSRRLDTLSYDELRKLEVGSWFGPDFAGEPIPTLAEAIDLARGRIKLNIELKSNGSDQRPAGEVARLVRAKQFESDCIVTSFDHGALQKVKRENPQLRTGLIVGHALGDVARLDVDLLSVRADGLSDDLLRAAQRNGMEVHAWTVNDARRMNLLLKRGVDNIITNDPELAIRVRDEWAHLTGTERLVLASRLLLGLSP